MMDAKRKQYSAEYKLKVVLESLQRDTTQEEVCHAMRNEILLSCEAALGRSSLNTGWLQEKRSRVVSGQRVFALMTHSEGDNRFFKNRSGANAS